LIENGASDPPAHYKVKHLPAVKSGIEHAYTYGYLRVFFPLEFTDLFIGIKYIARNNLCISAIAFRM